jgi:hypothetical protein
MLTIKNITVSLNKTFYYIIADKVIHFKDFVWQLLTFNGKQMTDLYLIILDL